MKTYDQQLRGAFNDYLHLHRDLWLELPENFRDEEVDRLIYHMAQEQVKAMMTKRDEAERNKPGPSTFNPNGRTYL
jgi:hypothetical protein